VVFFLVVAPNPESWGDLGAKYGSWMLALGCFTAVSLAVYFWLRWDTRRQELRELQREILIESTGNRG
jgi:type VI protein secretion system component VasK